MASKDYKAFIVEGEAREPKIIKNISEVFFKKGNIKILTLPAGENIYMLWKKLKEDEFDTDIIEILRESNHELREKLKGLSRVDFSEVYLFFDYDVHQNNIGDYDEDVVYEMLKCFDNETESGKLYINYPMVEALRDYILGVCGEKINCYVKIEDIGKYKEISAKRSNSHHFNKFDYEGWKGIIDVFSMRISCLFELIDTMAYDNYSESVNPLEIYVLEKKKKDEKGVFVLSAFPEFLVDYFGIRLWNSCVRHSKYGCNMH